MPICEIDPWRIQYFEAARCPEHVRIPTEDSDAWMWNPRHRWVYDRVAVAQSQGLDAGPHGTAPPRFPVSSPRSLLLPRPSSPASLRRLWVPLRHPARRRSGHGPRRPRRRRRKSGS